MRFQWREDLRIDNGKTLPPSLNAAVAQFFFPQRHCLLCGCLTGRPGLCADCEAQRRQLKTCTVCAAFVTEQGPCVHCRAESPLFTRARAAWPFGGAIRDRLHSFKYQEQTWLRRPLALLLTQTCKEHYSRIPFDAVIPAPISPSRLQERGYNQSELLSRLVAEELRLPHYPHMLLRRMDTLPLAVYNGPERRDLLRKVFTAADAAAGKTLLVVDDIYTTGATLDACAAALRDMGAVEVYGVMAAAFDAR